MGGGGADVSCTASLRSQKEVSWYAHVVWLSHLGWNEVALLRIYVLVLESFSFVTYVGYVGYVSWHCKLVRLQDIAAQKERRWEKQRRGNGSQRSVTNSVARVAETPC